MANNQINNEYVQKGYLKTYLANRSIKVISYDEWEHLCDCIDDAKAADVRENVRGEWKHKSKQLAVLNTAWWYECSICGHHAFNGMRTDFCPNCGAEMRGEHDSSQPSPRWIPVSERLPEDDDIVLITMDDSITVRGEFFEQITINLGFFKDGAWHWGYEIGECYWPETTHVTAWMPIAEPYKEGKA